MKIVNQRLMEMLRTFQDIFNELSLYKFRNIWHKIGRKVQDIDISWKLVNLYCVFEKQPEFFLKRL